MTLVDDRSTLVRSFTSFVEGRPVGDPNPGQFVTQMLPGLAEMLPVGPSRPTNQMVRSYPVKLASDTTFTLTVPPERFVAGHGRVGGGWLVKSLRINGLEVTAEPVHLESGSTDAVLTLTRAVGEVRGSVVTPAGGPDRGGAVVLFSTDRRLWTGLYARQSFHIYTDIIDETGRFTIANVRPGEYYLAAIQDVNIDPEILQHLAGSAVRVEVPAGIPIDRKLTRAR